MMNRRATAWACLLVTCAAAPLGCASASPSANPGDEGTTPDGGKKPTTTDGGADSAAPPSVIELTILPTSVYSGFDGTHAFQVPVSVYGAKGAKLVASDPAKVTVEPAKIVNPEEAKADNGESFMVTVKAAGVVKLTAEAGGKTASVDFTITQYPATRYAIGETRYKNPSATGPACFGCHGGNGAIDHSPTSLAAASDGEVQAVITAGILREGNPIKDVNHKWQVTDDELDGLVTYLRALPPRGYAVTR